MMKRDYAAAAAEQNNNNIKFQQLQSHPSSPPQHREYPPTSEDSHSPTPKRPNNNNTDDAVAAADFQFQTPPPQPPSNDGASIEVSRRSRGRPPGSKNKPKPPVAVARDPSSEPSMTPYVLQVPAGADVVEATARFCGRKGTGVCLLSGRGVVTNVTLNQPSAAPGPPLPYRGQYDILSISGTVFPRGGGYSPAATNAPLGVTLASTQGQVFGGLLGGPLVAVGTVYLVVAALNCASFERLQTADLADSAANESALALSAGDIGGPPIYSYQASDVVWAPSQRQSTAPPY